MRFRDQRAAALAAPPPAGERPELKWDECPFGCGIKFLAEDQTLTSEQFWSYGPWRMSVHVAGRTPGDGRKCGRPLFNRPLLGTVPTPEPKQGDTTEEETHAVGT